MGYDMTKYSYELWNNFEYLAKKNKYKLLFNKKKFIRDNYRAMIGKEIDLKNPKTFTEKLNANKINIKKAKRYSYYADKHKVRKYVKKTIGKKYLIEEYWAREKITPKDLEKLPNSFVLKCNNGSSSNYIVKDKKKENLEEICNYLNRLSRIKFGNIHGELLYNYIKPMIVAEKLMLDKNKKIPDDLKCFCFIDNDGNKRKILYYERVVGDDRKRIMFDENWEPVDINCTSFEKMDIELKKPKNHKEILDVIDKLSSRFNFVRVDLFLLDDKIYFGELTFIPTAGYLQFTDPDTDLLLGSYIGDNLE